MGKARGTLIGLGRSGHFHLDEKVEEVEMEEEQAEERMSGCGLPEPGHAEDGRSYGEPGGEANIVHQLETWFVLDHTMP